MWPRMTFAMEQRAKERRGAGEGEPNANLAENPECLTPEDSEDNRKGTYRTGVTWDNQSRDGRLLYPAMDILYSSIPRFITCSDWAVNLSARINW